MTSTIIQRAAREDGNSLFDKQLGYICQGVVCPIVMIETVALTLRARRTTYCANNHAQDTLVRALTENLRLSDHKGWLGNRDHFPLESPLETDRHIIP